MDITNKASKSNSTALMNKYAHIMLYISLTLLLIVYPKIKVHASLESGQCGDNLTYTKTEDGTLTISGTGEMWDFESYMNRPPWNFASKIIIEEGVTSIGNFAFGTSVAPCYVSERFSATYNYDNTVYSGYPFHVTITLPSTLERIGDYAFCGSGIYGHLIIPEGVTYVGSYAFAYCQGLNGYISLPSSLSTIGDHAFMGLENVTGDLVIPASLKNIPDFAFCRMSNISSVTFKGQPKTIGTCAFIDCDKVDKIIFPNGLLTISKLAFARTGLSGTVEFPATLTAIQTDAFYDTNIQTVKFLGNAPAEDTAFDSSKVLVVYTKDAQGFTFPSWHGYNSDMDRIKVTNITVSPSTETIKLGETITITATIEPSDADIKDVVWTLNGESVDTDSNVYTFKPNSQGTYRIKATAKDGAYSATSTIIVNGPDSTSSNSPVCASGKCGNNLTYTKTEDGTLTISGTGDMWDYEYYPGEHAPWANASKIIIEEGVTSIGNYAFGEGAVQSRVSDRFRATYDFDSTAYESGLFHATITLPSTLERIGDYAFCRSAIYGNLVIPEGVTYIGTCAFMYCQGLNGYISLPSSLSAIGDQAFFGLENVTGDLVIPASLKNIPDFAFSRMRNISSVTFKGQPKTIGTCAFIDCNKIDKIIIPNGLLKISKLAFAYTGLSGTIEFPATLTEIQTDAFYDTNIKTVKFLGNAPAEDTAFDSSKVLVVYTKDAQGFTSPSWHGYKSDMDRIKVTNITLSPNVISVKCYETITLTAIIEPSNADITDVKWSLDGRRFTANKKTILTTTPDAVGTFYIKATTEDGGFSATCTLVVTEPETGQYVVKGENGIIHNNSNDTNKDNGNNNINNDNDKSNDNNDDYDDDAKVTKTGDLYTYKNAVYKITKLPRGNKNGEAKLVSVVRNKTKITVPKSIKYLGAEYDVTSIAAGACKNNSKITSFTIGGNVRTIGDSAFLNCSKLKIIKLPNSVTSIGQNCYKNCSGATAITIGSGVKTIKANAFNGCKKAKKWTFKTKKLKSIGYNALKNTPKTAKYNVPNSKIKSYTMIFKKAKAGKSISVE